ncbi:TetR/AcrR family transcriptional regulator [Streptomyces bohaiensis]|uniref:TetR/AcrR family transcriptional regulator n=1 Tax=Streptomyces bohaiensis TaxID=1431344 RepID=UPI001ADD9CC3|nr:TetR/AcrR family transcriptional regulator [Streptomyces bohaiensis]
MTDRTAAPARRRLTKRQRRAQLLDAARDLIRDSGTDEFTLARLAERAGVTKPLVYDHFGDRSGVLAELYRAFEERRRETLARVLDATPPELGAVADVVAAAYVDCCLAEGRELADVVAALAGSPALSAVRREAEEAYLRMCREALEPLAGPIDAAALPAIVGAGDALARSALADDMTAEDAAATLARVVEAVVTGTRPTTEEG